MSVLACSRRGCENVMCDRFSFAHGYICDECFDELVNSGPTTDIDKFMSDKKKPDQREQALARYKTEFRKTR